MGNPTRKGNKSDDDFFGSSSLSLNFPIPLLFLLLFLPFSALSPSISFFPPLFSSIFFSLSLFNLGWDFLAQK